MPGLEGNRWLVNALRELVKAAIDAGHPISRGTIFLKDIEFADLIEFGGGAEFHAYPVVAQRKVDGGEDPALIALKPGAYDDNGKLRPPSAGGYYAEDE